MVLNLSLTYLLRILHWTTRPLHPLSELTSSSPKTDPFHKGFHLFLGCTGHHICPVKALLPYLAVRGSTEGPLFITEEGSPLTRHRFNTELSSILHAAGLETTHYNTHSFRIGAATSAKQAGISDLHIKMLGRWQSNAYETYIRTPRQQLAALSKQLVTSQCNLLQVTAATLYLFVYCHWLCISDKKINKKQIFFDWVAIWLIYLTGILIISCYHMFSVHNSNNIIHCLKLDKDGLGGKVHYL